MKETEGSYEALKTFFWILLRRYEKMDIDDFMWSEWVDIDKIQSFIDKWIREWLTWYDEETEYKECKALFMDSMKWVTWAEKMFWWYWLWYWPAFN